jgi:aryl-alcohol dehydrogenase-like predicted oxidoreductase
MYGREFDERAALATVDLAIESGVTLFDTADAYGRNRNEEFVGRALRGRRDRVIMATKFGTIPQPNGETLIRGDPEYVRSACEASLRRLETDRIDLYYCHRVDPNVAIEETIGAMSSLVDEGKVRYLGIGYEVEPDLIPRAHRTAQVSVIQNEWSIWTRQIEDQVLPMARELGIGIVPYAPLGRGFLTGAVRSEADLSESDNRRRLARFQGEGLRRNLLLFDGLAELARMKGCTSGQLALAWLNHQGDDVVPIPGADRPNFLSENIRAIDVELSLEECDEITRLVPRDQVV